MEIELNSIERNHTWEQKARLVAKGYSQVEGVDYKETYAPKARYTSIQCVLALAVHDMDNLRWMFKTP